METWKQKTGILVMVICLGMVLAALWYCLFVLPGKGREQGGTFVQMVEEKGRTLAEAAEASAWQDPDSRSQEEEAAGTGAYQAWPGKACACAAADKRPKEMERL